MPTIYQMTLAEVHKECERQAERANAAERNLRFLMSKLAEPYKDVVELEIRVVSLLEQFGTDATDKV